MEDSDPLIARIQQMRLPALNFENTCLEVVIEALREQANRFLAASPLEVRRTLSVALLAAPSVRLQPITRYFDEETPLLDVMNSLAHQAGLGMSLGALGIVLCPMEAALCMERILTEDRQANPPRGTGHLFTMDTRLNLVTKYPALGLGTAGIQAQQAFVQGYHRLGGTPESAVAVADLLFALDGKAPACLTGSSPVNLPSARQPLNDSLD